MKQICLLLLLSILVFSCRKERTSWNADYAIPLINDSLTLENYVNDSTLAISSSGAYEVDLQRELVRFDLTKEVEIPDTNILSVFSNALSVNVPPGFSIVNDVQEISFSLSNLELSTIYIEEGKINVTVSNTYPTSITAKIVLPLTTKSGVVVTDEVVVGPGTVANPTSETKSIDIAYANMDLKGVAQNSFNKLPYEITVTSDPTGPSIVSTAANITEVSTTLSDIKLFYAKGYFGNRVIKDTVETDVELLNSWITGSLDVQNVDLNLNVSNSIKAMGRIKIVELSTTKMDGTTTILNSNQINVPQNVNSATGAWSALSPSSLDFSFTSSNSNIEDFIENAGPKIRVIYEFELNPLGNNTLSNNEVFPTSAVKLDLDLKMPLTLGLNNFTLQDTVELNLANNRAQLERAKGAEITVDTENGFPLKGEVMLSFLNEMDELILAIPNSGIVQSGLTGMTNSFGLPTSKDKIVWNLDEDQLKLLQDGTKMIITGTFDTQDANSVYSALPIKENSFLATKVYLSLTYQNEL